MLELSVEAVPVAPSLAVDEAAHAPEPKATVVVGAWSGPTSTVGDAVPAPETVAQVVDDTARALMTVVESPPHAARLAVARAPSALCVEDTAPSTAIVDVAMGPAGSTMVMAAWGRMIVSEQGVGH